MIRLVLFFTLRTSISRERKAQNTGDVLAKTISVLN